MDYTLILNLKYPATQWTLNGDDYEGLTWLSDTPKPSKAELDAQWGEVEQIMESEKQAKIDAKLAAEAKLEALGLTSDDLKALGL